MGLDNFGQPGNNTGGGRSTPYTDEELIQSMQDLYEEVGKFTAKQFEKRGDTPGLATLQRRFDSFNKALKAAGIPLNKSSSKHLTLSDSIKQPSENKAYIIGYLLTDGWITVTSGGNHIGFQSKDKELATDFGTRLTDLLDLNWDGWNSKHTEIEARGPIHIGGENSDPAWRVKKGSNSVSQYFKKYENKTAEDILDEFSQHKNALLTSIWDSEGSISKQSKTVRFANSNTEVLKLYMKLVNELIGVDLSWDYEWTTDKQKNRNYGEFRVSTTIADSDTRNIAIPTAYNDEFISQVNTVIPRKKEQF